MPNSDLPRQAVHRVRRILGRIRRSETLHRAKGFVSIQRRRAAQRLRSRFVLGVWLHTEDYLAAVKGSSTTQGMLTVQPAARTLVGLPTFVPPLAAPLLDGTISINVSPRRVTLLDGALVVGDGGAVISHDRRLLWDLSYEWPGLPHSHTAYELRSLQAEKFSGVTATIAAMAAESNYFHFLFNSVARLAYLKRAPQVGVPDRYLISGPATPFVTDALRLFGIPASRITSTSRRGAIQAERLVAPSLVHHPFVVPAVVCEFLRTTVLNALLNRARHRRRIFIDRSDAATRRIHNLDALSSLFASAGIECVRLAGRSLAEQAALFNQAELVIGNHGAALSNLVFCDPGTRVLQVLAPGMMEREYRTISQHGRLRHDYVVGDFATTDDGCLPRKQRDLTLSPDLLRTILRAEGWL